MELPFPSTSAERPGDSRGPGHRAIGALRESFRPYLLSLASRWLSIAHRGKCDEADLVQETLLEAHRHFARFDGLDSDDLRVWLCGILKLNLKEWIRRYRDDSKRSIDREWSLEADGGAGDAAFGDVDPYPTPCAYSMVREDVAALRQALSRLPADEQTVIGLRHLESLSFQEIGLRLARSPEAARKLCSRAIVRLQGMLKLSRGAER